MRYKKLAITISGWLLITRMAFGAFEDIGVSARAWGMGNTFVGIGDSASSIYYNPAALVRLNRTELLTSYSQLYYGLSDESNLNQSYLAFAYPLGEKRGTIALEWLNYNLPGYYTETTLAAGYASRLTSRLVIGLTLKSLLLKYGRNNYTVNDPVFARTYDASAISADFAMLYEPAVSYRLAFVLTDILNPNVGLQSEEKVPMSLKFGFGYSLRQSNLGLDIISRNNVLSFSSGLEYWLWRNSVALRLGTDIGSGYQNIAFGLGYTYNQILRLDYGMSLPLSGIKGTSGSHRLTIGLKFGPQVPVDLPYSKSELEAIINEAQGRLARIKGAIPEAEETSRLPEKVEVSPSVSSLNIEQINSYYNQGLSYYETGNYEKAITQWNEILKIDPSNQQALVSINKAARIIQQQQKNKRDREEANRLAVSGEFDYSNGDYQAALSKWEKALLLNPNQTGLAQKVKKLREEINNKSEELYTKGLGLYYNNKIDEAIAAWKEAIRINPYHEKASKALNKARKEIGQ